MSSSNRTVLTINGVTDSRSFVIVDESSYIKGHNSLRTKRITALSEKALYRLILTGTPISQGVVDLYAQMRFLSSKILGYNSFYSFAANHLEYSNKYPGLIVRSHNTGWLAAKIQPYVYQITKEECLDLPDKIYDQRYVRLSSAQWSAYEQAKCEILLDIDYESIDSYIIFQLFTALQQIVSGFWNRRDPKTKKVELWELAHRRLDTLRQLVCDIPAKEKIIIWCKFRYSVEEIRRMLSREHGQDAVACLHGGIAERDRSQELSRFRESARFLVVTMSTGGHGLTLNEAAYVIFYENDFKYANRIQAEDRNHRIGQGRQPTYIDIVSRSGIEDRIMEALAQKGNAVQSFKHKIDKVKDLQLNDLKEHIVNLI